MKKTVIEMLRNASIEFKDNNYLIDKHDEGWKPKTFGNVENESNILAIALHCLNINYGDKIAILAEGRANWVISEFAIIKNRAIAIPLSVKLTSDEILFRLNHSESKGIFISKNNIKKLEPLWEELSKKDFKIFYLDDDEKQISNFIEKNNITLNKDIFIYNDLLKLGEKEYENHKEYLNKTYQEHQEDDVVTISYTSGTTGNPKGIMLTQLNYYTNSKQAIDTFKLSKFWRTLILLPLDHSFAHTVGIYVSLIVAIELYFIDARNGGLQALKNIPSNLKETKPKFLLTVPAITGNFIKKIREGIEKKGAFATWLFNKGLAAGQEINLDGYKKAEFFTKLWKFPIYKLADIIIFKKLKEIFGGDLEFCVGGGALLDISQQKFYYTIGIPVFQGYGLTEATPIISTNVREIHKLGTSGIIMPYMECKIITSEGTEAKVREKGEIVIKGDNIMKGYFKNSEATQKTIKDNWLYTGDMGYYDDDNFLVVTGREKALLISQDGEKYSPEGIEEAIVNSSQIIEQVMTYNDHSKYTTALITINTNKLSAEIKAQKYKTPHELFKYIEKEFYIFKNNSEYKNAFQDKWVRVIFTIIPEHFTEANKMINSTMKMVRYKITENYKDKISNMYENGAKENILEDNLNTIKELFFSDL